jgi:hypothetical protein
MTSRIRRTSTAPVPTVLRFLATLFLLLAGSSSGALAQTITGTVVDDTGAAVEWALVEALDGQGRVLARSLSVQEGLFRLSLRHTGTITLRAGRIGFSSAETAPVEVSAQDTVHVRIVAGARPVRLETLEARGTRGCAMPASDAAVGLLWQEIDKALRLTRVSEEDEELRFRATRFVRDVDTTATSVLRVLQQSEFEYTGAPFYTRDAADLVSQGFAVQQGDTVLLLGPTADVLLSKEFIETHCFTVVAHDDPDLIGLGFEPRRRRPVDIRGVLWVDARSAELRYLDFTYANHRLPGPPHHYGGEVGFARTATGRWHVDRWVIRSPLLERFTSSASRDFRQVWTYITALREDGGVVIGIEEPSRPPR